MVLERIKLKGSIKKLNFKNFYVGITESTGAVFVSTDYLFKTSFLKPYSPKFYAKKAYQNIKQDKDRFILLNKADEFAKTREKFIRNLAEWETPSDVDNISYVNCIIGSYLIFLTQFEINLHEDALASSQFILDCGFF